MAADDPLDVCETDATAGEFFHGMKFFKYLNERGGRVILTGIEAPQTQWDSIADVFKHVYEHEQKVTGLINNLNTMAREEKDYAMEVFLSWFIQEQVEEESTADGIIKKLKMIGENGNGMFMMDQEMGKRVFVPPTA